MRVGISRDHGLLLKLKEFLEFIEMEIMKAEMTKFKTFWLKKKEKKAKAGTTERMKTEDVTIICSDILVCFVFSFFSCGIILGYTCECLTYTFQL